jgi:hypothetical protein
MVEDWLANAYGGMSRREFVTQVGATGIGFAGFSLAATPVAGKVMTLHRAVSLSLRARCLPRIFVFLSMRHDPQLPGNIRSFS